MDAAQETAKAIIADILGVKEERVVPEARLIEDLEADSLLLVELAMKMEDTFTADGRELKIPDDDLLKIRTVRDIYDYLAAWTAKNG